jgi:membrane-associated phospholipid phosphatase
MSDPVAGVPLLDLLHKWDLVAYRAVATTSTPLLDEPLRQLSTAANYSRLSMAAAAALAAAGGRRGRRAAVTGLVCVAVTSATVNIGAKLMTRRERPDRELYRVVERRRVEMPESTSFPSGHSAAAFAFASGVRHEWPALSVPLYLLAAAVAYSRVHTGVHYPGDVLVGSAVGVATAILTGRAIDAVRANATPPSRTDHARR